MDGDNCILYIRLFFWLLSEAGVFMGMSTKQIESEGFNNSHNFKLAIHIIMDI